MTATAGEKFQLLVDLMARLRGPDGCPWDREQTFDTIKPYLLEETYEVLDAIDARDWRELAGELGDLTLQAVFFSQMASERNLFRIDDALDAITEKLIRRHPHVFGDQPLTAGQVRGDDHQKPGSASPRFEKPQTGDDVRKIWSEVKSGEKPRRSLLDGLPRALPALVEAQQISSRAAGAGFDWETAAQVVEKVQEELGELDRAETTEARENEIGDVLFTVVNLARFLKVDPEQALRRTNAKFRDRFGYVERKLAERGKTPGESTVAEMEALWQESKSSR
ncbi:MAG: nucleoside triphosphate pyrophosphohydrolase [Bryobacteraceae bacterium]